MCQIGAVLLRIGPSETTKRYSACPSHHHHPGSTWKCYRYAQTKARAVLALTLKRARLQPMLSY
jgi:hypothetical protein